MFAPADVNQDGDVDLVDLLCVLDAFAGNFASCPAAQSDVWPCAGDGVVDLLDSLAALDGFTGLTNPCCKK